MPSAPLLWSETELLATDEIEEPLFAGGRRCHGGFAADGSYRSPRTAHRITAIEAWQQHHRESFGTELLDVPLETWPETYPNVDQMKLLLERGVRDPMITLLTRIGTVEGFGAMIRYATVGDKQRFFDEPIDGTALAHLEGGLFEAHARDEAGWEDEAGHRDMWFAARDVAFEDPVTEDQTAEMLTRLGLSDGGGMPDLEKVREQALASRRFDDLDLGVEMLVARMMSILLIEIQAFHTFRWAETVLGDTDLVAGEAEAARLVSYIRQDETPHVEYLKTALTEMRDRTFIGESGARYAGEQVVGEILEVQLEEQLGVRRQQFLKVTAAEVERAIAPRGDAADLLEEFHSIGTIRPGPDGEFVVNPVPA
jgi:hypothetical protein